MRRTSAKLVLLSFTVILTFTITCSVFDTPFSEMTIDWLAFLAGIFLMIEGTYRILGTDRKDVRGVLLRGARVITGTCIFTIHLLQFMRK